MRVTVKVAKQQQVREMAAANRAECPKQTAHDQRNYVQWQSISLITRIGKCLIGKDEQDRHEGNQGEMARVEPSSLFDTLAPQRIQLVRRRHKVIAVNDR